MAHIDIFRNDAFRAIELSEAVRDVPNMWGEIGEMGIFVPKPIRGVAFSIELQNGHLQLVQSSTRGTPVPGQQRGKRKLKKFETARFALKSKITADDIDGIRAFGSETELKQVATEVADRQEELRGSTDVTREYLRAGALQGMVLDADGSELLDLHDEFGITRKSVDFVFGTATTDIGVKAKEVERHIKLNLRGDVSSGIGCLMHPEYADKLESHPDFKERYKHYQNENGGDPLRDPTSKGFLFKGIWWKEYLAEAGVPQEDGTVVTRSFIPAAKAQFFPMGTRQTFRQFNGSPDYMGMTNMPGQEFYSKIHPDRQEDRFVDVEVMMQTMPICMRPAVLVEGSTSN
ncbi:major capsid protein [uncultured Sulfitobacter sp.]|uniref:major capsid protein n=1 Tax=uncultured Sulfitobacter sp. TaxID=191468 RepID=UPI002611A8AE|nr:major capsid protein [uncultured Sulfitobacter sp.]